MPTIDDTPSATGALNVMLNQRSATAPYHRNAIALQGDEHPGKAIGFDGNGVLGAIEVGTEGFGGAGILVDDHGALGDGTTDDIAAIRAAYASAANGGTLVFSPGKTYRITETWQIAKPLTIEGNGATIDCRSSNPAVHSSAILVVSSGFNTGRFVTAPIAIGNTTFTAAPADITSSALVPGDWIIIDETDASPGNQRVCDWAQVLSIASGTVTVTAPFRTAFTGAYAASGTKFHRINPYLENVTIRNLHVTGDSQDVVSIYLSTSANLTLDSVRVTGLIRDPTTYLCRNVTIKNSLFRSRSLYAGEVAATADFFMTGCEIGTENAVPTATHALLVDLGVSFARIIGNAFVGSFKGVGLMLQGGIWDSVITGNVIRGGLNDAGSSDGILLQGAQRCIVRDNIIVGGAGTTSYGVRCVNYATAPAVTTDFNHIGPNVIVGADVRYAVAATDMLHDTDQAAACSRFSNLLETAKLQVGTGAPSTVPAQLYGVDGATSGIVASLAGTTPAGSFLHMEGAGVHWGIGIKPGGQFGLFQNRYPGVAGSEFLTVTASAVPGLEAGSLIVANGGFVLSWYYPPASATAPGVRGTIAWDTGFLYVCTATSTWKRTALSSW